MRDCDARVGLTLRRLEEKLEDDGHTTSPKGIHSVLTRIMYSRRVARMRCAV